MGIIGIFFGYEMYFTKLIAILLIVVTGINPIRNYLKEFNMSYISMANRAILFFITNLGDAVVKA